MSATRFLYGDVMSHATLSGFEILTGPKQYVVAVRGEDRFYVAETEGGYRLHKIQKKLWHGQTVDLDSYIFVVAF